MLIYTKARELLEKDLIEQEKADPVQEQAKQERKSKKIRRFFHMIKK
ncbi:hypothetical protein HNR44_003547 [Geomicrobium halophilum]|uniref:Uncharacterized protein n=1 Tax=Geomicrobium halophilum TaxID=549000 RepID=A0A841PUY2_9BACL|nr:hypothetical protein [Geomicrobium halophilum]MBB6451534.1 hypothetical protein [Geomicrobium halophilum]